MTTKRYLNPKLVLCPLICLVTLFIVPNLIPNVVSPIVESFNKIPLKEDLINEDFIHELVEEPIECPINESKIEFMDELSNQEFTFTFSEFKHKFTIQSINEMLFEYCHCNSSTLTNFTLKYGINLNETNYLINNKQSFYNSIRRQFMIEYYFNKSDFIKNKYFIKYKNILNLFYKLILNPINYYLLKKAYFNIHISSNGGSFICKFMKSIGLKGPNHNCNSDTIFGATFRKDPFATNCKRKYKIFNYEMEYPLDIFGKENPLDNSDNPSKPTICPEYFTSQLLFRHPLEHSISWIHHNTQWRGGMYLKLNNKSNTSVNPHPNSVESKNQSIVENLENNTKRNANRNANIILLRDKLNLNSKIRKRNENRRRMFDVWYEYYDLNNISHWIVWESWKHSSDIKNDFIKLTFEMESNYSTKKTNGTLIWFGKPFDLKTKFIFWMPYKNAFEINIAFISNTYVRWLGYTHKNKMSIYDCLTAKSDSINEIHFKQSLDLLFQIYWVLPFYRETKFQILDEFAIEYPKLIKSDLNLNETIDSTNIWNYWLKVLKHYSYNKYGFHQRLKKTHTFSYSNSKPTNNTYKQNNIKNKHSNIIPTNKINSYNLMSNLNSNEWNILIKKNKWDLILYKYSQQIAFVDYLFYLEYFPIQDNFTSDNNVS